MTFKTNLLRNRRFKGSSSPKDISFKTIRQAGFVFLKVSWITFLLVAPTLLKAHDEVNLFLDNDLAGKEAKENLLSKGISFHDA